MKNSKLPVDIKVYESIEEFDANLPDTVKILTTPQGSKIYLIGTAHFSPKSQDDVSLVIRNVKPDVLMLELCHLRVHALKFDEETLKKEIQSLNRAKILDIVKENGVLGGSFYVQLLKSSARIAEQLGQAPGGEFRRAFAEVQEFFPNCKIILGDRPINITVQRAIHGLTLGQKLLLTFHRIFPEKSSEIITQDDIEEHKKLYTDNLGSENSNHIYPSIYNSFVKERDIFLANALELAARPKPFHNGFVRPVNVVGVVGIGHLQGIMENWGRIDSENLKEFLKIPPPSIIGRVSKLALKYGTLTFICYGAYKYYTSKSLNDK